VGALILSYCRLINGKTRFYMMSKVSSRASVASGRMSMRSELALACMDSTPSLPGKWKEYVEMLTLLLLRPLPRLEYRALSTSPRTTTTLLRLCSLATSGASAKRKRRFSDTSQMYISLLFLPSFTHAHSFFQKSLILRPGLTFPLSHPFSSHFSLVGFIFGRRTVGSVVLPLEFIGAPMRWVTFSIASHETSCHPLLGIQLRSGSGRFITLCTSTSLTSCESRSCGCCCSRWCH
jgi:hypothetical protein